MDFGGIYILGFYGNLWMIFKSILQDSKLLNKSPLIFQKLGDRYPKYSHYSDYIHHLHRGRGEAGNQSRPLLAQAGFAVGPTVRATSVSKGRSIAWFNEDL